MDLKPPFKYFMVKTSKELVDISLKNYLVELIGCNIRFEMLNDFLIVYHKYSDDTIITEGLKALELEMFSEFMVFLSRMYNDMEELIKDRNVIISLFMNNNISYKYYTEKELFSSLISLNNISLKQMILGPYFQDYSMYEIISVFLKNNMNTSISAKILYMHRNTLINKLDRFCEKTGYDLRKFSDAHLVYSIIQN